MIKFKGYERLIDTVYRFNQGHIFEYFYQLNHDEKKDFFNEIFQVDFELMKRLYQMKNDIASLKLNFEPAPYISFHNTSEEAETYERAKEAGIKYIEKGKTAILLVAGGQGTRLGFDGPKGMFPVGPVSKKTLFQIFAEKIIKYSQKYRVSIPWFIMTSRSNHVETVRFFEEKDYFGLNNDDVFFFSQNMIPSLDNEGKLILENPKKIFMNPDGHGGSLTALFLSGSLEEMKRRGIETISYFQVDNPIIKIIDPVFIGFHVLNDSDVSSKAVRKIYPEEKVGVFVRFDDGKIGVMEYFDLSKDKQILRDSEGRLIFCMGNIAIHLFKRSFIEEINSGINFSLPYHLAKKKIKAYSKNKNIDVDGYKFEKFIFDSLNFSRKSIILEIEREDEFAPIKNKDGLDSIETAAELMSNLSRKWLLGRGVRIPEEVNVIEISPLLAVEPDDLKHVSIEAEDKVFLK